MISPGDGINFGSAFFPAWPIFLCRLPVSAVFFLFLSRSSQGETSSFCSLLFMVIGAPKATTLAPPYVAYCLVDILAQLSVASARDNAG